MNPTQTLIEELKARTSHSARPRATIDKPLFRKAAAELNRLQAEVDSLKNPESVKKWTYLGESNRCPHCRSPNIEAGTARETGYDQITNAVDCLDCHKTWTDIYTLTDVEFK